MDTQNSARPSFFENVRHIVENCGLWGWDWGTPGIVWERGQTGRTLGRLYWGASDLCLEAALFGGHGRCPILLCHRPQPSTSRQGINPPERPPRRAPGRRLPDRPPAWAPEKVAVRPPGAHRSTARPPGRPPGRWPCWRGKFFKDWRQPHRLRRLVDRAGGRSAPSTDPSQPVGASGLGPRGRGQCAPRLEAQPLRRELSPTPQSSRTRADQSAAAELERSHLPALEEDCWHTTTEGPEGHGGGQGDELTARTTFSRMRCMPSPHPLKGL